MSELVPVVEIDGARIGAVAAGGGAAGPVTERLQRTFAVLVRREREPLAV
jgi:branched-subunit amino acid aminotransferase/4-amino-4-deoxychorismate lyase